MKRFTLRKVKQYSYSRQGWKLKDLEYVYVIYDREWQKNAEMITGMSVWSVLSNDILKKYKYIDNARSKEVAQYWADWLNDNKANVFGVRLYIPRDVFTKGLELYGNS